MLYRVPVDTSPVTEGVTLFKYQLNYYYYYYYYHIIIIYTTILLLLLIALGHIFVNHSFS